MSNEGSSDYQRACHWSHNHLNNPPQQSRFGTGWIMIIVLLLIVAAWFVWARYTSNTVKQHEEEKDKKYNSRYYREQRRRNPIEYVVTPSGTVITK